MKKMFKQTLSLVMAVLMVLSLVPTMSLSANAEEFTPGAEWTIPEAYTSIIQGAFTPAGDDFVYEANDSVNWKAWIVTSKSYTIQSKAMITYNGQTLTKTKSSITTTKGENYELWTPSDFPEITATMYGNFTLTVEVYYSGTLVATGVLNFVRNAPVPVETEPAATEPVETEPVETEPAATEPVEVVPANMAGFRVNDDNTVTWLETTGKKLSKTEVNTAAHMYGIGKGGYATCAVSEAFLLDFNGKVTVEVEYATTYGTNFTFAYTDTTGARKDAEIAETKEGTKSNTMIAVYNIEDAGFNGTLVSGGEAFGILANDTTGIKAVVITKVVEETPEEPTEPEQPVKVEYKAEWSYAKSPMDFSFLNGAFNTAEEDFIFDGTPYDWTVTVNSANSAGVRIDATVEMLGSDTVLTASKTTTIPAGEEFELFNYSAFSQLTNELVGNFRLTTNIVWKNSTGNEVVIAQLVAVFGRSAAYTEPEVPEEPTEPEVPEEPETPATPTKPGEVVWQYGKTAEGEGYEWLTGAIATETAGGIYKGWDAYDWAVTLSPTKTAATVTVEAEAKDHTGAVVGTVTKNVDVSKAPSVTTILTAGDLGLSTKTLGDFLITAVIKYTDPTTGDVKSVAQVQFVVGRRIGDTGYTAVEYLPGHEWITGSFTAVDEDMTYVGIQRYDWRATIAPSKSEATVDVAVTVVNAQGETVATLNKTGVVCAKGATTALVTAGEIAELTADLYGKFAVTTVASMSGKQYVGIYGVIEHVEGEFVADTIAPEFAPANWESCGLPDAVTVANNGEMNKQIEITISITDAQGTVLASMNKTATVGAGASGELVTTNQLRKFITERGATYYVVIEGRWSNGYDEYTINETLTYVWAEHTDTEVVPGYAATCTEPGLTDGVYCHGCEGTIVEQTDIPAAHSMEETEAKVEPGCETAGKNAVLTCSVCGVTEGGEEIPATGHNYVDGVCACGATSEQTDANLKLVYPNTSGGDLMLGDDIRASFLINAKNLSYEKIYLEFVRDGATTIAEPNETSSGTTLRYAYVVPAAHMTSDITITVYGVKNGVTYRGEVLVFSIRRCVEAKMEKWITNAAAANQCKLLMNMLYYGEQAQLQFGINKDKLATAGLPQEYLDLINSEAPSMGTLPTTSATGKVTKISYGLQLQEKVKLSAIITASTAFSDNVKIVVVHHRAKQGDTVTYTYATGQYDLLNSKNIRFYFDKIAPSQMRDEFEITVYEGDVAVSATYVISMDMACNQTNYINNMPSLIYAIMNYADAAKVVFG